MTTQDMVLQQCCKSTRVALIPTPLNTFGMNRNTDYTSCPTSVPKITNAFVAEIFTSLKIQTTSCNPHDCVIDLHSIPKLPGKQWVRKRNGLSLVSRPNTKPMRFSLGQQSRQRSASTEKTKQACSWLILAILVPEEKAALSYASSFGINLFSSCDPNTRMSPGT